MFGMIPKRKPLDNPWQTPPFNPAAQQAQESPVSVARPQMAPEPQKGGFFAPGGTGRAIAGYMGDFLLQQADMQPIYQPQMQLQQAMAAKQREASLKRDADMQDWLAKEAWKLENNPDKDPEIVRLSAIANDPTRPEHQRRAAAEAVEARNTRYIETTNPLTGEKRIIPVGPGMGQTPTVPVGRLTPIEETGGSNAAPGFPR